LRPAGFGQYVLQNLEQDAGRLVQRLGRALLQARYDLLQEEQIDSWLRRLESMILAPHLRDFWSPFYITLMVSLGTMKASAEDSLELLDSIHNLTDLYDLFLRETIAWEILKGNNPEVGIGSEEAYYEVLGYAAYYTFVEPVKLFQLPEQIASAMRTDSKNVDRGLQFWLNTGLLVKDEKWSIAFRHTGFKEFGVAYALADMWHHSKDNQVNDLRQNYADHPEWETIWQLFMGLV
jgi:hypothetical protein